MDYRTVKDFSTASFTEKKSEFIGSLVHVDDEEEAVTFINRIRSENRKARHNVYAYILRSGNISRYSDDGEPQGTGGVPVLEVLKGRQLTDVCLVVTRYFGGILLGTGGLARAYSKSASLACDAADIMEMCESISLSFECDYSMYGMLTGLLSSDYIKTVSCDFEDRVRIQTACKINMAEDFTSQITEISNGTVIVTAGETGWEDFADKN